MRNFRWLTRALAEPSARAFVVGALLLTSVVVAAFTAPDRALRPRPLSLSAVKGIASGTHRTGVK